MSDPVFSVLFRKLEEKKRATEEYLAQGNARSYEEYLRIVGEYAMVLQMLEEVKELERRLIED